MKMPVIFVGHGSPMNAIEDTKYSKGWIDLAKRLPHPSAILAISAHYYEKETLVNDSMKPKQIFDMYGFSKELYSVKYQPDGNKALAHEVVDLIPGAHADTKWGLDHGVWSVLKWMYPNADVPVVEMSVNSSLSPEEMFALGRKLSVLRDQGVLIVGSGNIVHNLMMVDWENDHGYPWAEEFSSFVTSSIEKFDFDAVLKYKNHRQIASLSVPTEEHFDPLFYVLGAVSKDDKIGVFNDSCELGSIAMTGYVFGL